MSSATDRDKDKPLQAGGDEDCTKGPITNRACTDVICLVIFFVWFLGFFILACTSYAQGNPKLITAPQDFKGARCGLNDNFNPWNNDGIGANTPNWDQGDRPAQAMFLNVEKVVGPQAANLFCQAAVALGIDTGAAYAHCSGVSAPSMADASAAIEKFSNPDNAVAALTESSDSPLSNIDEYFHYSCVSSCDDVNAFVQAYASKYANTI